MASRFGDDALGYFTERQDLSAVRTALAAVVRWAKRNKAFDGARRVGLAIDGTGVARSEQGRCELCHAVVNAAGRHQLDAEPIPSAHPCPRIPKGLWCDTPA